ncbi:MAG TPA: SusC/RagA family TonB-linked outer membrane protein [Puia sp.]
MKLMIILLVAACLNISAAGYGQKVSISGKDLPLEKVFTIIKKQTGYVFFYDYSIFQGTKNVTLDLKDADIEDVMRACLRGQDLDFSITNKTISITRREEKKMESADPGPQKTVKATGIVMTEAGTPLLGASVTIKETGKSILTNEKGGFSFSAVAVNSVLVFSYIGYTSHQVVVKEDQLQIQVYLVVAVNELDKAVVQAYGTTSRRLSTGNIVRVGAEEIAKQPVMNPLLALQGQVTGLEVTPVSGYASGKIKIELRGRNSIMNNTTSDPLYIIDGVPLTILELNGAQYSTGSSGFIQNGLNGPTGGQSPFFSLNPLDIESIEVLKDADATAIYGSRAANGVILITTKKGKAGRTQFNLNVSQGISAVTRHWDMLNTHQYLQMRREAFKNTGQTITPGNAPDILVWDTTRYTDWQKYLWGNTGKWTDVQTALSGGDARTVFRIAAGYRRQTDITTVSGANQNASVSFNLTHHNLNQKFSVSFTTFYSYAETNMIDISNLATLPPDAPPVFDRKGNLNYAEWDAKVGSFPFGSILQPYDSKTNFLTSNLVFNYNIFRTFVIRTNIGYNNAQANQTSFVPIASQDPAANPTGFANFGKNSNHNWIIEPQAEYNGIIGKGKFNVLLGCSAQQTTTEGQQVNGRGYTNDALLRTISNAPSLFANDNYGQYKYAALFGRIAYNWENKYILDLNARRDGSSRFGPGNQFGNFGSVGAAWILSEESWIKKNLPSFFSFIKLRGSYGTTGGDAVGDYAYLSRWSGNNLPTYQGISPLVSLQHANIDYHWQVNRKLEGAMDLGFLKDRITLNIAYYRNRCDNQLVAFPTAEFTGFTSVVANSPANVENTGWEFMMNARIINTKNFSWTINFNTSINHNKLLSYPNLELSPYYNLYKIGQPLNLTWLLHLTGVDPQTGQYTYQDRNHDGAITTDYSVPPGTGDDDRYVYNLSPKFIGGLGNSFSYKKLTISFLLYFKKQSGANALLAGNLPGSMHNQPVYVYQNRWQKPGDITNVARVTTSSSTSDSYFSSSDGYLTDASFIRLSNLSISYSLPQSMVTKLGMVNLNLFLNTNNIFTITKYKGLDPETQNFGDMPPARTIVAGFNCNF